MESILEELWCGNIIPYNESHSSTNEAKELVEYIERHRENLTMNLSSKQKETLEKLEDCYTELIDINERETFKNGFRLGMKMIVEIIK